MKRLAFLVLCGLVGCANRTPQSFQLVVRAPEDKIRAVVAGLPDVNATDRSGSTLLHYAATVGNAFAIRTLLERGARVDVRDDSNRTPLYIAAGSGSSESAYLLLAAGADPNSTNGAAAEQPLQHAAEFAPLATVELLLRFGARVNDVNRWGQTPLLLASRSHLIRAESVVLALLAAGADAKVRDSQGFSPLDAAVVADNTVLVHRFLGLGLSLDGTTERGSTPLDLALADRRDLVAEQILSLGGKARRTAIVEQPLQAAAKDDDVGRALFLLAHGANPSLVVNGTTATQVALDAKSDEVAALFDLRKRVAPN